MESLILLIQILYTVDILIEKYNNNNNKNELTHCNLF